MVKDGQLRFSGHESFVCRYGWLPKLYEAIRKEHGLFSDEEGAVVKLGIGKNMVRSIRFWGEAFGLATYGSGHTYQPTLLADTLLDQDTGLDPYLEDHASLWLLHWQLTVLSGLGAWHVAFQDIYDREILKSRFMDLLRLRSNQLRGKLAETTLKQHFAIFLGTYVTPDFANAPILEDSLGCPFQELGLVWLSPDGGKDEILQFDHGPKQGLTGAVFIYTLFDYWQRNSPESKTLSLRTICLGRMSPGTVFKLDENSVLGYLDQVEELTHGMVSFIDTADTRAVRMRSDVTISQVKEFCWAKHEKILR